MFAMAVSNGTSPTVRIAIPINANVGARTVMVSTGPEALSLANGFTVQASCLSGKESGVRITEGPPGSFDKH
jgi:hypothetical protein